MAGTACPRCRTPVTPAANFCAACGLDLREPSSPAGVFPPPPAAPRCWNCGGILFQFFPNGRATCYACKQIYGWTYSPYGQIILMPAPGFL